MKILAGGKRPGTALRARSKGPSAQPPPQQLHTVEAEAYRLHGLSLLRYSRPPRRAPPWASRARAETGISAIPSWDIDRLMYSYKYSLRAASDNEIERFQLGRELGKLHRRLDRRAAAVHAQTALSTGRTRRTLARRGDAPALQTLEGERITETLILILNLLDVTVVFSLQRTGKRMRHCRMGCTVSGTVML